MSSQSPGIGSALPDMNANTSAYVLTNDGVTASWEAVTSLGLPPMGGNSGKYLTNNGSAASWAAVTADGILPSQTGKSGQVLTTNGTTVAWAVVTGAGVDALGAVGSSPAAEGASIAGTTLTLQPADATHPGVVTTTTQPFAGVKTFNGGTIFTKSAKSVWVADDGSGSFSCIGYGATINASAFFTTNGSQMYLDMDEHIFRTSGGAAPKANLTSTSFDMTGLGNSGSIKLKDDAGATKTCTISGGVWVIT